MVLAEEGGLFWEGRFVRLSVVNNNQMFAWDTGCAGGCVVLIKQACLVARRDALIVTVARATRATQATRPTRTNTNWPLKTNCLLTVCVELPDDRLDESGPRCYVAPSYGHLSTHSPFCLWYPNGNFERSHFGLFARYHKPKYKSVLSVIPHKKK